MTRTQPSHWPVTCCSRSSETGHWSETSLSILFPSSRQVQQRNARKSTPVELLTRRKKIKCCWKHERDERSGGLRRSRHRDGERRLQSFFYIFLILVNVQIQELKKNEKKKTITHVSGSGVNFLILK